MPYGPGTYGSKKGRPPMQNKNGNKKKKPMQNKNGMKNGMKRGR
tara:strand:+ start:2143 stop:2274 length:132 start_codon:yes stop_codon:yes gene_type:complete